MNPGKQRKRRRSGLETITNRKIKKNLSFDDLSDHGTPDARELLHSGFACDSRFWGVVWWRLVRLRQLLHNKAQKSFRLAGLRGFHHSFRIPSQSRTQEGSRPSDRALNLPFCVLGGVELGADSLNKSRADAVRVTDVEAGDFTENPIHDKHRRLRALARPLSHALVKMIPPVISSLPFE